MLTPEQKSDALKIFCAYGAPNQLNMLVEECMELSLSLHKNLTRSRISVFSDISVISELADVYIMLEQCSSLFDRSLLSSKISFKLSRELNRLNS